MPVHPKCVNIGTVSGGIVNFGGAVFISPISTTQSANGSGGNNQGADVITNNGLSSTNGVSPTKLKGSTNRSSTMSAASSSIGLCTANQKMISDMIELLRSLL